MLNEAEPAGVAPRHKAHTVRRRPRRDVAEIRALDEMFAASERYRSSKEYMKLLKFMSRFPNYSPFNAMLLHTQNPAVSFVATAGTWARDFGRWPKPDARPLVILAPMSPVLFVFDLKDTVGAPVPDDLLRPFSTEGKLQPAVYQRTLHNCSIEGIAVREVPLRHRHAGSAMKLTGAVREKYRDLHMEPQMRFLVLVNDSYSLEDKYSSLAHELAHVFCGHVGVDDKAWWENGQHRDHNRMEVEAESVSYLVCLRKGLKASSRKYLSAYRTRQEREMELFSFADVIDATTYVEKMGASIWREPVRKPRRAGGKNG